ncbi:NAD(P)/FAD-dependent oxidoreductase [Aquisediminimonas sediminicola]|uniref:NAD(P)/FAD-dependent oxidoreductase n=1 Tax=Alteraquisediminimonas sediminicola TaxID=2676787 RepID=UPI001C8E6E36|nr:flavin monoamine oxidase family protein [Aquisediminimonas sediminicola]
MSIKDFTPSRRQLLSAIGTTAGSAAAMQAMAVLGHAAESRFTGPPQLTGTRKGASVLVLGAGLAGLVAAYELNKAGYKVRLIEYQGRPGGRNWSLRGGDTHVEVGGAVQKVEFAPGNYLNPGPWRIPHHHKTLLHYCRLFNVALQPFIQMNHNAYVHQTDAFGGKPMRYKEVATDFKGHVSELMAKAINQGSLDDKVSKEDKERLLEAMRSWGVLDKDMAYTSSLKVSAQRGYDLPPGGGVGGAPTPSAVASLSDMLDSKVWNQMGFYFNYVMQTTMFQPVGGMDMVGKAFAREVDHLITYNAKVTKIAQNAKGVTVTCEDMATGAVSEAKADYCVCAIPASVLSQIEMQAGDKMLASLKAVNYSASVKTGLEFKRRFWEEDEAIYGGHSFTNQPISLISYPNYNFFKDGPAVLLGSNAGGLGGSLLGGMEPAARIEAILAQGEIIHPQYRQEFMSGVSVAWGRVPWNMGGFSRWSDEARKDHYANMIAMDGRIVLAGEHASYIGGWMEGALTSAIDAITRLHKRTQEA